jgi:glycosyltransferase involved in cell wall biosynthesis
LVRALAQLPKEYFVLFLGDGPLRSDVETELRLLNVRGEVVGFINQSALGEYYAAADLLVVPSDQETWGLVANEIMACGKPVVASDRVGCAYDLLNGGTNEGLTGAIYPCGDVAALGDAIRMVSGRVTAAPTAIAQAVRHRIAAYDVSATTQGLVQAFLSKQRISMA